MSKNIQSSSHSTSEVSITEPQLKSEARVAPSLCGGTALLHPILPPSYSPLPTIYRLLLSVRAEGRDREREAERTNGRYKNRSTKLNTQSQKAYKYRESNT